LNTNTRLFRATRIAWFGSGGRSRHLRDYNDGRLDMVGAKAAPSDLGPQTTLLANPPDVRGAEIQWPVLLAQFDHRNAREARSSDVPTWQDVAQ
jgi:hypothetical protein